MTSTIDIDRTPHVDLAGADVDFAAAEGQILLTYRGRQTTAAAPRLLEDRMVEAWADDVWFCLVGSRAPEIVVGVPSQGQIDTIAEVERLDLGDAYDPGGLHRVQFEPLEGGDLLVVHEFGAARVSPNQRLVWQRAHRDLTAHVTRIHRDRVEFTAEAGSFAYHLADGRDA
jgi:hypothetical protein